MLVRHPPFGNKVKWLLEDLVQSAVHPVQCLQREVVGGEEHAADDGNSKQQVFHDKLLWLVLIIIPVNNAKKPKPLLGPRLLDQRLEFRDKLFLGVITHFGTRSDVVGILSGQTSLLESPTYTDGECFWVLDCG